MKWITVALLTLAPTVAFAEDLDNSWETTTSSSGDSGGNSGTAVSAGDGHGIGVGVAAMITGPQGIQIVYDKSAFHIEGILAFADAGTSDLDIGGRFWYHIHSGHRSNFSIGGGLGLARSSMDVLGMSVDTTTIHIDLGAEIRAFVTDNVALSADLGLSVLADDGDGFLLGGSLIGAGSITYFF